MKQATASPDDLNSLSDPGWVFAIRLLSADCTKSHFGALALSMEERTIEGVSDLAKHAYAELLGSSRNIFGIDFRESRIAHSVQGLLDGISQRSGADSEHTIREFGNWYCCYRRDENSVPDTLWSTLMLEFVSDASSSLRLSGLTHPALNILESSYSRLIGDRDQISRQIVEALSPKNITSWDASLVAHTPDDPKELADSLVLTIDARTFRRFWETVQLTLTKSDARILEAWLLKRSGTVAPSLELKHRRSN